MGYTFQTGTIGPIVYPQDNSGNPNDMDLLVNYTPEMFGAPPGAQVIQGSDQVSPHVDRGKAYVHDESVTPEGVSFYVYTQAANNGIFGWHSGAITVTTTFQWYYITETAVEAPAVLPRAA